MAKPNSELFSMMMQICGLDFDAAADLLSVDPKTILVWFSGTQAPDQKAVCKLAEFARFQSEIADEILESWRKADCPESIKYGASVSDAAARNLGWPSRAAQVAAIAQAQITLAPLMIEIVPMPIGAKMQAVDETVELSNAS